MPTLLNMRMYHFLSVLTPCPHSLTVGLHEKKNTAYRLFEWNQSTGAASVPMKEVLDKIVAALLTFQNCKIMSVSIRSCCVVLLASDKPLNT